MTNPFVFDQSVVRDIGARLTATAQAVQSDCYAGADLGDNGVRASLDALVTAVNNGLFGAAAEVLSLGQSSIDAADAFEQADKSL